jgi:hypothetical protein
MTAIEAESIQEGANLLLTFGNIRNELGAGNDIFTQTTKIMVDMGVALKKFGGTDPITIDKKVSYVHLSHNLVVKNGREFSISKYRLPRYFLIFRYLLTR